MILLLSFSAFSQQSSRKNMVCRGITASQTDVNKIQLNWKLPESFSAASIVVFRATQPIKSISELSMLKPIAELPANSTFFTDTLQRFDDYHYALIARDKEGNLQYNFIPASNITVKPVKLKKPDFYDEEYQEEASENLYHAGQLRGLPLPSLNISDDYVAPPKKLSQSTIRAGKDLAGKYADSNIKKLPVYVFEDDLVCAPGGDDYFLFQSLKTYFIKKDYEGSIDDLKRFLGINRSPETTKRALFYLAESFYFNRNYKQALSVFLYLQNEYPQLSKKWIDSSLDNYKMPVRE